MELMLAIWGLCFVCTVFRVDGDEAEAGGNHQKRSFRVAILLAVAYSANVGGTGTLIGSGTQ